VDDDGVSAARRTGFFTGVRRISEEQPHAKYFGADPGGARYFATR
jgi:hypothetical protein